LDSAVLAMDRANNTKILLPAMDSRNLTKFCRAAGEPRLFLAPLELPPSGLLFLQTHKLDGYCRYKPSDTLSKSMTNSDADVIGKG